MEAQGILCWLHVQYSNVREIAWPHLDGLRLVHCMYVKGESLVQNWSIGYDLSLTFLLGCSHLFPVAFVLSLTAILDEVVGGTVWAGYSHALLVIRK